MQIHINGESRDVAGPASLQDLISILNLKAERLAIELNGEVVRLGDWATTELRNNDKVEIVHFVGGGNSRMNQRLTAIDEKPLAMQNRER